MNKIRNHIGATYNATRIPGIKAIRPITIIKNPSATYEEIGKKEILNC